MEIQPVATPAELAATLARTQVHLERAWALLAAFNQNASTGAAIAPIIERAAPVALVQPTGRVSSSEARESGANLSAAAGANLSARAGQNLSANLSVPADAPPPPASASAGAAPMASAPPPALLQSAPPQKAGYAALPLETLLALRALQYQFERTLPVLSAVNDTAPFSTLAAGGAFTNPPGESLAPVGRPSGRPAPAQNLRIK